MCVTVGGRKAGYFTSSNDSLFSASTSSHPAWTSSSRSTWEHFLHAVALGHKKAMERKSRNNSKVSSMGLKGFQWGKNDEELETGNHSFWYLCLRRWLLKDPDWFALGSVGLESVGSESRTWSGNEWVSPCSFRLASRPCHHRVPASSRSISWPSRKFQRVWNMKIYYFVHCIGVWRKHRNLLLPRWWLNRPCSKIVWNNPQQLLLYCTELYIPYIRNCYYDLFFATVTLCCGVDYLLLYAIVKLDNYL